MAAARASGSTCAQQPRPSGGQNGGSGSCSWATLQVLRACRRCIVTMITLFDGSTWSANRRESSESLANPVPEYRPVLYPCFNVRYGIRILQLYYYYVGSYY
eukprot:COSAG02_NODE_661_length_18757_cov_4.427699_8_plen_102_part_00